MTRTDTKQLLKGLAFISPWLIGFTGFMVIPVILSFYYSLCDYSLLQKAMYTGGENYQNLAKDSVFWLSLKNTFYYAIMALPAGMIVSLGMALMLNARIHLQGIYRTLIFIPSLVPAVASAMVWMYLYNPTLGLYSSILSFFEIDPSPQFLGDARWAMPSLAFMSLWGVGNTVVIYLAGLQDVPEELYEAAEIDGAGNARRLWHVTLPMISPVIFFNLVMAIIGSLQVFAVPYIMCPAGAPARSTYFYTEYLYDNAFLFLKMGYASSEAWIQLLIVMVLTGIAFWSSRKWVHYQGK